MKFRIRNKDKCIRKEKEIKQEKGVNNLNMKQLFMYAYAQ